MKILITGANGFLGQHLTLYLSGKGYDVIASSRGECRIAQQNFSQYFSLDIIDSNAVAVTIATTQPDVIIHAAAMSKPDECANNKEACYLNNVTATKFLLDAYAYRRRHHSHRIARATNLHVGRFFRGLAAAAQRDAGRTEAGAGHYVREWTAGFDQSARHSLAAAPADSAGCWRGCSTVPV